MTSYNNKLKSTQVVKRIWSNLSKKRKYQFTIVCFIMLCSGLSEFFSLASVIPLLTVITNPNRLWNIEIVKSISLLNGIQQPEGLIIPITILFALSIIISTIVRLLSLWINGRFAAAVGSEFSCKLFKITLFQPYSYHINRNTSEVIAAITSQLDGTVIVINLILQILTGMIVSSSLLIVLILNTKIVALYSILIFGFAYLLLVIVIKNNLLDNSILISKTTKKQIKLLQEGLGGIKEILLDNTQKIYIDSYKKADIPMRRVKERVRFLALFPRIALEAMGILTITLAAFILSSDEANKITLITTLGTFALGAQKLIPSLQQIYASWAGIKASIGSTIDVLNMLEQPVEENKGSRKKLKINDKIELLNISFNYSESNKSVINKLNLTIPKGERIGLIGATGSGKSTLLNIIMGLLKPKAGTVKVNHQDINNPNYKIENWMSNIAHVPQTIFLKDSSLIENIAFGEDPKDIDINAVKTAAQKAKIASYINSLPFEYKTIVGERGVKLSGGQRQRIGIARAFYKNSDLIVLDEATSALDNKTEKMVMKSIEELGREKTIIIIAHRLSTLSICDRIIEIKAGEIVEDGKPSIVLNKD